MSLYSSRGCFVAALAIAAVSLCSTALAGDAVMAPPPAPEDPTMIELEMSYELVSNGQLRSDAVIVSEPASSGQSACGEGCLVSGSVRKAAALANYVDGLAQAAGVYFEQVIGLCEEEVANAEVECPDGLEIPCAVYIQQVREEMRLECLGRSEEPVEIDAGSAVMVEVVSFTASEAAAIGGDPFDRELELADAILDNMAAGGRVPPREDGGISTPWSSPGGGGGATPGGAQDFGYVRSVVEWGYVPLPHHLDAAGLFSEHDLPVGADVPCAEILCVRSMLGEAPVFGGDAWAQWLQIGFSSTIDPDTFERTALNLVVVLDRSGSMWDPADEETTKIEAVKSALLLMVDQLGPADRLAIVLFNSEPWVLQESTAVTDRDAIKDEIRSIVAGGGTNIEGGLELGFELAVASSEPGLRSDRVLLLTDALPNVGLTGEDSFVGLARSYSEMGVGLSTFGVGYNFGQELVLELSQVRGGNYFFLEDADRIHEVFAEEFKFLVTPLAYDFSLTMTPGLAYRLQSSHGVAPSSSAGVATDVATLFFSRRRGAILLRLEDNPYMIHDW